MIESEHMSSDPYLQEHTVSPTFDKRAVGMYELLRKTNPWLPDPTKIPASATIELSWGGYDMATLNLVVVIDLPSSLKKAFDL